MSPSQTYVLSIIVQYQEEIEILKKESLEHVKAERFIEAREADQKTIAWFTVINDLHRIFVKLKELENEKKG